MTRPELSAAARAELATREAHYPKQVREGRMSSADATIGLAAWRAIVALLDHGSTEFEACLGDTPQAAWPHLVEAAEKAVAHRLKDNDEQLGAVARIRTLIWRSAHRAGALDTPAARRLAA